MGDEHRKANICVSTDQRNINPKTIVALERVQKKRTGGNRNGTIEKEGTVIRIKKDMCEIY